MTLMLLKISDRPTRRGLRSSYSASSTSLPGDMITIMQSSRYGHLVEDSKARHPKDGKSLSSYRMSSLTNLEIIDILSHFSRRSPAYLKEHGISEFFPDPFHPSPSTPTHAAHTGPCARALSGTWYASRTPLSSPTTSGGLSTGSRWW